MKYSSGEEKRWEYICILLPYLKHFYYSLPDSLSSITLLKNIYFFTHSVQMF